MASKYRSSARKSERTGGLALVAFCASLVVAQPGLSDTPRMRAVRTFADNVLEKCRDQWSGEETPLLADGINLETGEPVVWRNRGREYIIHNLASQQNLFRVLTALTNLTGEERYKNAAKESIRYHFEHLVSDCGLLRWGGHQIIDLRTLEPVGDFDADCHELKWNLPYYELLWEVDSEATRGYLRALWRAHILDWHTLALNRHAPYRRGAPPTDALWERDFAPPAPFFESDGLSFLNCGADLIYGGAMLYLLGEEQPALTWAKRLAEMYTRARHPETGMGAYQFTRPRRRREPPEEGPLTDRLTWSSYGDRMENKFAQSGSTDPDDEFYNPVKGKVADDGLPVAREGWAWYFSGGFPIYTLAQLHLAESIGEGGEGFAEDAADHLEAHARHAYDPEANHFRPMWADGTDVTGLTIPRTGYGPGDRGDPYHPRPATPRHLAAYARAYRLTERDILWDTARRMARGLGLGDIGRRPGEEVKLDMDTARSDPRYIFALIELHRAAREPAYLRLAERIGENILEQRFHDGFFLPDKFHLNANFDAEEPLALLALEAALRGEPEKVPAYVAGRGYIHGRFDGHGRTYDHRAIWGRVRTIRLLVEDQRNVETAYRGRQIGTPSIANGSYRFDGQRDAFVWDDASTGFEDGDRFSIVLRARMFDDNRFLCAWRYHLSRQAFRTRGNDPLTVELPVDDDALYHIVVTYDGAGDDGERTLKVYIDGELAGTDTGKGSPLSTYDARPLNVGRTEHSRGIYSNVAVQDGVRIYSGRVLSPAEVKRLAAE